MAFTRMSLSFLRWCWRKLEEMFSADLRSLAAFRIAIGWLAFADVVDRAFDLTAHYTDRGILPREALLHDFRTQWTFSLHLMSGDRFVQAALFLIAACAALAVLVGWRTRQMTVLVWVLMISVQSRNPMVLSGADFLIRMLFFWAMFLPLGACWSIDRLRQAAPRQLSMRFLSFATVGLFAQIAFMYWFSVKHKSGAEWRTEGSALYYALSIDQHLNPLGAVLYQFPTLLSLMTFGVFWLEALGPFLLFSPIFTTALRMVGVLAFVGLHMGIWLTMSIGSFPWVASLAMLCFLPAWFWDSVWPNHRGVTHRLRNLFATLGRTYLSPVRAHVLPALATHQPQPAGMPASGGGSSNWNSPARAFAGSYAALSGAAAVAAAPESIAAPDTSDGAAAGEPDHAGEASRAGQPLRLRLPVWTNLLAAFFIGYVFCTNLTTVSAFRIPAPLNGIGSFLRVEQAWNMFSPYPSKDDGWYVIPGTLRGGMQVDLFPVTRGDLSLHAVNWEKPHLVSHTYKNERWRKYMMNLWQKRHTNQRLHLGRFLCREWNSRHTGAETLQTFEIVYMLETTLPNYQRVEPKKVATWRHSCV